MRTERSLVDRTVTGVGVVVASGQQPRWVDWVDGTPGVALAFFWGLAEGTFFFVVPDVVISLAAMLRPRRAWRHVVAAVMGSLLAGALMFGWAARNVEAAREAAAHVPFVRAGMFLKVDSSYERHGLGAVFRGPLTGTPYKIYAVEAPEFVGRGEFLASTIPARGYRFVVGVDCFWRCRNDASAIPLTHSLAARCVAWSVLGCSLCCVLGQDRFSLTMRCDGRLQEGTNDIMPSAPYGLKPRFQDLLRPAVNGWRGWA